MPVAQLAVRNVFIYDRSQCPPLVVAGCRQFGRMTNAELYSCLWICFQQPRQGEFRLSDGTNILPRDENVLAIGNYFVISPSTSRMLLHAMLTKIVDPPMYTAVVLSNEELRPRIISGGSPASQVVGSSYCNAYPRHPTSPRGYVAGIKRAKSQDGTCPQPVLSASRHVTLSHAVIQRS